MTNLSQWFDLAEQKPWEVGVYEVTNGYYSGTVYSVWNGKYWSFTCRSIERAILNSDTKSRDNIIKWRGLSTNPEVKKKPQNKRKTMYVVMDCSRIDNPAAVFTQKENAQEYADRISWPRIKKTRFRTPE